MQKITLLLFLLCIGTNLKAQVINIPDANFKAQLVGANLVNSIAFDLNNNSMIIDTNNNGEIEVSEALLVGYLGLSTQESQLVTNLEGIKSFANLRSLACDFNSITSLDVSDMVHLVVLSCGNNLISTLNISGCSELMEVRCQGNSLSSLSFSNLPNLHILICINNPLTSFTVTNCPQITQIGLDYTQLVVIDVSTCPILNYLFATHCPQLTTILAKNGSTESYAFDFSNSPNVTYVCGDENQLTAIQNIVNSYGLSNCQVNSYCSFSPGGNYYTINGTSSYDANSNGCDSGDAFFPAMRFAFSNGSLTGTAFSNSSGVYQVDVPAGTYTVTPLMENPSYFLITPSTATITFPTQNSPFTQNFCIRPNGTQNDLEVTILPVGVAIPGFDAHYKIVYKNKGTHPKTGNVTLNFEDGKMDYVSSNPIYNSQSTNMLTWDYANLLPFETREIEVSFSINTPAETLPVNNGDQLDFLAQVYPNMEEVFPIDNSSELHQIVVGSYDPNDKTCLEGTVVQTNVIGKYVHYLIRFENTGNYPAQNIVIKDIIDTSKFTTSSLIPISSSHPMVARLVSSNRLEFLFENIQLPFDDANNDGYVAFKIKTRSTLVEGNTFSNTASIYFDYNFPIVTNTATTTIQALANPDFEFSTYFELAPNPTQNILNIRSKNEIELSSISIYNTLGQLILVIPNAKETSSIDVSKLESGNYFVKVISDKGSSTTKFIKK